MSHPLFSSRMLSLLLLLSMPINAQVVLREAPLVLPSYSVGAPDPTPFFYDGRNYQGARGAVYPYALQDRLTNVRDDRAWNAVYLENPWIEISMLPEIGGRIFSGLDRTNGYDFFYRQHVIKPALVGMLGAWISGGVEWNIPHHHRASSYMPVSYTTEENVDGSKTVWMGETEWRHRMRWIVGVTVFPDRSYVQTRVRLFNPTPFAHSYLYWANPAVHANEAYQVIFPPSVQYATFHGKRQFARWPISAEVYNGVAYAPGTDISWWKNHPNPTSFFAWQAREDFLAGYDHSKNAGIVHVADHHTMPGKKFWEWGNGPEGRLWDKVLTDSDGPYIELMVGGGSDNQPDYSWIQPGQTREFVQYWYPVRNLGGVRAATRDAALNLEVSGQEIQLAVNTTAVQPGARIKVGAVANDLAPVFERTVDLAPDRPYEVSFVAATPLPSDLVVTVQDARGRELVRYRPETPVQEPFPQPVQSPADPEAQNSVEELYQTALRIVQFYDPSGEPYPYLEEALRRDPGHSRSNTLLGHLYLQRGMFAEAEKHLQVAVDRLTANYTSPRDLEALYLLGLTRIHQERFNEAEHLLGRASWGTEWGAAANIRLAELAARRNDWQAVTTRALVSLDHSANNPAALVLLAMAYRNTGAPDHARLALEKARLQDPLNPLPAAEALFLERLNDMGDAYRARLGALRALMRGDAGNYLEAAVAYANAGRYAEAINLLQTYLEEQPDPVKADATVYYHLADYLHRSGHPEAATPYETAARTANPDYVFPFRLETMGVLARVRERHPDDGRALYYLGNLLYDRQPEVAIRLWEQATRLDPELAMVWRNVAFGYAHTLRDTVRAVPFAERAVSLDGSQPRPLFELDRLYEATGVPITNRLATLNRYRKTVEGQDYLLARMIRLQVESGSYDEAIALLKAHRFHNWEGGESVHRLFEDAFVARASERLDHDDYRRALSDLQTALTYPENIEAAPSPTDVPSRIHYLIGQAQLGLRKTKDAQESFRTAAAGTRTSPEEVRFKDLAARALRQ